MTAKFPSDPKIIGPGIWFIIHSTGKKAINDETKRQFIDLMNMLRKEFPCEKCRGHIDEYMTKNPIEEYYNLKGDNDEEIGMFKWSWMFHNAVNTRIGKPYVDWETAYNMFSDSGIMVCSRDCGEPDLNTNDQAVSSARDIINKARDVGTSTPLGVSEVYQRNSNTPVFSYTPYNSVIGVSMIRDRFSKRTF